MCRVIVVENDVPLRAALAQLLSLWGYEVETASDGLEAVGKMPKFDPAVVVSSLEMPRLGGMELLEVLRHGFPKIRCIVIGDDASGEKATEAIRLGAFSFLEKPLETERLHMDLLKCQEASQGAVPAGGSIDMQPDIASGQEVVPLTDSRRRGCDYGLEKPVEGKGGLTAERGEEIRSQSIGRRG